MADDKKKEEKGDEAKKKKGLSPVIMIAIGAIIGGAGVVFAIPPKTEIQVAPPPEFEEVHVLHPDLIKHTFNPKQRAGKGVMKVSFQFVYTVLQDKEKKDMEHAAFEMIKKNWDLAKGASGAILRSRTYEELQSEAGENLLKHDISQELTQVLFGQNLAPGQEPIAKVTRIVVQEKMSQ